MKYYTSGEFAKKANVTIRTIRYYDNEGILKASMIDDKGKRLYTDEDFLKLQKILSLKLLGFSLNEIADMTYDASIENTVDSFKMQLDLLEKKIEHLSMVEYALKDAIDIVEKDKEVRWDKIVNLIHLTTNEHLLIEQYKNSRNLDVRIALHKQFSKGKENWFQWMFKHIDFVSSKNILEVGCGNGQFWVEAPEEAFKDKKIYLSDLSSGMVQDAMKNIGDKFSFQVKYQTFDCERIPYDDSTFDIIMANHMLFYINDLTRTLNEFERVLREDGTLYCTTYSENHMHEVRDLVSEFDNRIKLSDKPLYEKFGLENGREILSNHFKYVDEFIYDDVLLVDKVEPLMNYILSCHGNQSEILQKRQSEFKEFLIKKMSINGYIKITKQAVLYRCSNLKINSLIGDI